MTEDVWAVFSAFRPGRSLLDAVDDVQDQVRGVIVVDDGSAAGNTAAVWSDDGLWERLNERGVIVRHTSENAGIAAALTAGIDEAYAHGATAVVTFDQDSRIPEGFIAALLAARDDAGDRSSRPVAIVVPEFFASVRQARKVSREGILEARHVIQSGMLVPRAAWESLGTLRTDLFIDLVDTEFELRANARGWLTVVAAGVGLGHSLGVQYERRLFGWRVNLPGIPSIVTLSSPFRYYYRVRNRRIINRAYGRSAPLWILRDSILEAIHYVNALALARPRRDLWRIYRLGWRDGRARGRRGKGPASLGPLGERLRWAARRVAE